MNNSKMKLKLNNINGNKDCFSNISQRKQQKFRGLKRNIYDAIENQRREQITGNMEKPNLPCGC